MVKISKADRADFIILARPFFRSEFAHFKELLFASATQSLDDLMRFLKSVIIAIYDGKIQWFWVRKHKYIFAVLLAIALVHCIVAVNNLQVRLLIGAQWYINLWVPLEWRCNFGILDFWTNFVHCHFEKL